MFNETYLLLDDIVGRPEVTPEQAARNRAKVDESIRLKAEGKRKSKLTIPVKPRPEKRGLIPVRPTTWWKGVKEGIYPQPVKLSPGRTGWRKSEIDALVERINRRELVGVQS